MRLTFKWVCLTAGLAVFLGTTPYAKADDDDNRAHEHQGVLAPYEASPLDIKLSDDQLKDLAKGELVIMTIEEGDSGGRGIGVLDVHAPPDTVWSRIKGFQRYPQWVGPVDIAEVYKRDDPHTFTHIKISGFLYAYEYYLKNTWWPEAQMLTWTLDYSRRSEFDDCVGIWFVEPHPDKAGWSRAWFSSDLKLRTRLPGFLMNFIKRKGLKDATSWVKEQSELAVGIEPEKADPFELLDEH